jgi:glycerol-1-phosphate dehydrogenase [NAD(P)+]
MDGLIETGLCMLDFGQSHPASGAEHHLPHFWELKLLRENRPAILHGLKVGIASIVTTQLYDQVRQIDRTEAADRLAKAQRPDRTRLARRSDRLTVRLLLRSCWSSRPSWICPPLASIN